MRYKPTELCHEIRWRKRPGVKVYEGRHYGQVVISLAHKRDGWETILTLGDNHNFVGSLVRPAPGEATISFAKKHAERSYWNEQRMWEFNEDLPVGTSVLFWPMEKTGEGRLSKTRSKAWLVCGFPVVKVEGYSGGIALTHIEVVEG